MSVPQYLLLGEILRPHGVRGEMRVKILTDYPERIGELDKVYLGDDPESKKLQQYSVASVRMHQGYALLVLKGISDRDEVERLRGLFVMVSIDDAVPLEDDEIYLFQLIGMQVETESGEVLGKIIEVLETGANDVYIVNGGHYGEVLIPVTDETLVKTDEESGKVVMRLPEGLLPGTGGETA